MGKSPWISPHAPENSNSLKANEPVGAIAYSDEVIEVEIGQIPGIPHTWDELSECLKEGEEEYERCDVGFRFELGCQFMGKMKVYLLI